EEVLVTHLSRLAGGVLVAASVSACDKGPDPADRVKEALEAQKIDDVHVKYDRDSKAIHLTGSVDSAPVKERAERVAAQAVGTSGNVLNELTVKGTGESHADDLDATI